MIKFISCQGARAVPEILLVILLALFIAPVFKGILNFGNVSGAVITASMLTILIKYDKVKEFMSALSKTGTGKAIVIITAVIISAAIIILTVINVFMVRNLHDYPKQNDTTVIVLGCRVKDGRPSLMLKRRLDSAYGYLNENPSVNVIVSGGKGSDEIISEAECMKTYLVQKGISPQRIFMEDKSTSTYENFRFSQKIISQNGLSQKVTVITDGYHQLRAEMIAGSLGFTDVSNISAPTSAWLVPTYWVREWFGIVYQFAKIFFGKL